MKNSTCKISSQKYKSVFFSLAVMLVCNILNAQLATFPLQDPRAANGLTTEGHAWAAQSNPNVVTGVSAPLSSMYNAPDVDPYNYPNGYRVKTRVAGTGVAWPTSINDNFGFDIPIKPQTGFDMNITSITLNVASFVLDDPASHFTIVPYFQADGTGPFRLLAGAVPQTVNSVTTVSFGPLNETFYNGHNYVVRFYIFNSNGSTDAKNDEMRINTLVFNGTLSSPPSVAPTVTTTSATATGLHTANVVGSYQSGAGFHTVYQSGLVWGTAANPVYPTDLNDTSVTAGSTSATITNLAAGTLYHVRSYIITQFGIFYGEDRSFTTFPPTAPIVTTNAVSNVLSNKATGGGVIVDSGGVRITSKGLVWGLTPGATITSNAGMLTLGSNSLPFSGVMKILTPSTNYCYRAFAINSIDTSYGADVCFATSAPVPVLNANPATIDFGEIFVGSNAIVTSYILTGSSLSPASGTITVSISSGSGFLISTNSSSGFSTSITVNYSNGQITNTPIYVQFPATSFGTFTATITHSGGGASGASTDDVILRGTVVQSPEDVSNTGTDFYLGFGYEEKMSREAGNSDECRLSVYVTNPSSQAVRVHCDLTMGGYAQVTTIPAFGSYTFSGFPMGDPNDELNPGNLPDARLFSTGISNKSIHVYTENNIPVAVHMHSYTHSNSAAGAMVFPTNTWNSSYTVQAFGGESNNSNPNSFFFVIANEDNTEVTFTPTQPILDASPASLFNENLTTPANTMYAAGSTYTVTLNKGQVFNAMGGFSPAGNGMDLSGTKVSTKCDKKITVFGGNGRCLILGTNCNSTSGSDHLIQQMFPSVAWGTKYLTAPTANTAPNYYRIYFQDPVTPPTVLVNGTALTAAALVSVNGTPVYYQYQSDVPISITSDKPINVSQFMLTPACTSNSSIDAGPEMIILSPVEQAISNVVFFSPTSGKAIIDGSGSYTSYMNVIIPTSKAASFKLDGVTPPAGSFVAHPQDAGYSYARLLVTSLTKHSLTADTGFVAIAYGYGDGESYGFNAGTAVKNLSSYKFSVNPEGGDSSSTIVRTCVNTPITLKIGFPHLPSQVNRIVWEPDPNVNPAGPLDGPVSGGTAVYEGTKVVDGRTFYIYKSPTQYVFNENGLYRVRVTAYGNFLSDCPGEDRQTILVNVGEDIINLTANPSCGNPTVPFTADTIPMVGTHITSWEWDFGNGPHVSTGTMSPQNHTYPNGPGDATEYIVKLTTKNTVGCISRDSIKVDFGGGLESKFTIDNDSVCMNVPVTFTDASTGSGTSGSISSWEWSFGSGSTSGTFNGQAPPPQSYSTYGIKTVELTVRTPIGCVKTFKDTVVVEATPVALIKTSPTYVCFGDSAAYRDSSTIAVGAITSWEWLFDDGTTSTLQNPKHLWQTTGIHTVKLVVRSTGSCKSDTATHIINVNPLPKAGFRYDMNCTTRTLTLTDTSNGFGTDITAWDWDFGDATPHGNTQNPVHIYAASGTYTVTLTVTTANGCRSAAPESVTITIAASPVADFTLPGTTCLPAASPAFQNTTTISDGTINQVTYIWNFGDGTGDLAAPSVVAVSPTHVFPGTGPYTVTLTAISNNGCTNSVPKQYSAIYERPTAIISAPAGVCLGNITNFSSASSTAPGSTVNGWNWDFGDGVGTSISQNPTYTYAASGPKTVKLTVTSAAGCVSNDTTVSFSVNLSPTAGFTYDAIRCEDSVITFNDASTPNGSPIVEWKWDFAGEGNLTQITQAPATFTFANSGSKNVSLTVKDANGCSNGTPFVLPVVINPNPAVDFSVSDICVGTGLANFTQNVTLASGQIAIWNWSFGGNTPTASYTYATGGEYNETLTATSDSGCKASKTKLVKAFTAPTTAFDVNNPTSLCSNQAVGIIDRSAVTGYGAIDKIEIYWDYQGAPLVKQTINAPSANSTYTNQYTEFGTPATKPYRILIRAFNGPGCSTDLTQDIDVLASPQVQFTQPAPVCQEANSFTLTGASDVFGLPGSGEYSGDGVNGGSFTPAMAGAGSHTIKYTYTTTNGCADFEEKDIVVNPTPVINFGQATINILEGDVLKLNPSITYGASYLWTPATYLNNATSPTPSGIPSDDIIYSLQVTSDKGCVETESVTVKVVRKYVVPNTFTPNNDGNHDVWDIENLKFYPDVRVRIFTRGGQMVFESYGYDRPWDGKFKGQDCPFGTYYYVIETGGGRSPRTGYVTIIR